MFSHLCHIFSELRHISVAMANTVAANETHNLYKLPAVPAKAYCLLSETGGGWVDGGKII